MKLFDFLRLGLVGDFVRRLGPKRNKPSLPNMAHEIFVPGQNSDLHNGFVNCKNNQTGLQARFFALEGQNGVGVVWERTTSSFEGYPGLIHGGVTAALLDELMTNTVFHTQGKFGVTFRASFSWKKPLATGSIVKGFGQAIYANDQFVRVKAYLFRDDQRLTVEADGLFYLPTSSQFTKMSEISTLPPDLEVFFRGSEKREH